VSFDFDDEVIRGSTVVKDKEITWPPPPIEVSARPSAYEAQKKASAEVDAEEVDVEPSPAQVVIKNLAPIAIGALALFGLGAVAPPVFMGHFTVFVLSCFIGYMVIWNVTPSLHTPLMSVTNAISSIIIIGALIQVSSQSSLITILSAIAILIATINIVGGFAVTQRMLKMFGE
jgi:NAD(P) transhydrogenase subunit alpha